MTNKCRSNSSFHFILLIVESELEPVWNVSVLDLKVIKTLELLESKFLVDAIFSVHNLKHTKKIITTMDETLTFNDVFLCTI